MMTKVGVVTRKYITLDNAKDILKYSMSAVEVLDPLVFQDSPKGFISNRAGSGFGKATIVLSEGGIFGVTAKHVMVGGEGCSNSLRDIKESESDKDI